MFLWAKRAFLILALFLFAACTSGSEAGKISPLAGTGWAFTGFGSPENPTRPIPESKITAVFTPTTIQGSSGCNQYSSPYTINGRSIQFAEMAATAMDCPSPLLDQEAQFLEALRQATRFTLSENELVIETAVTPLIFHPQEPIPLTGTTWQLTGIAQDGVIISTWVDERITAVFTNGKLSGNAGCNRYTGTYTLAGEMLSIHEIANEALFCDEERNRRETQFLTALSAINSYTTGENNLTLLDDNNALLTFAKAPVPNPLSGVIWELVALETANGPLPARDAMITAQFVDDVVAGSGGCNAYAANTFLATEAYLLLLNTVDHSLESCSGPVNQLENTFFRMMETAVSFTLDNNILTIFTTHGSLSFTVAPFTGYQPPFVLLPDGTRCSRTTTDDFVMVNDKQRRYYCFQSGPEMTILIGDFQPAANGWTTEKAIIVGTEEAFTIKDVQVMHVTLP